MRVRTLRPHDNAYGDKFHKVVGKTYDHPDPTALIANKTVEKYTPPKREASPKRPATAKRSGGSRRKPAGATKSTAPPAPIAPPPPPPPATSGADAG